MNSLECLFFPVFSTGIAMMIKQQALFKNECLLLQADEVPSAHFYSYIVQSPCAPQTVLRKLCNISPIPYTVWLLRAVDPSFLFSDAAAGQVEEQGVILPAEIEDQDSIHRSAFQRCPDQPHKQWMRMVRAALEFRVKLYPNEKPFLAEFHSLYNIAVRGLSA